MSRSVHTSRAKFRKAFRNDYSTDEERTRVLGKIIDEVGLKRDESERPPEKAVPGERLEALTGLFGAAVCSFQEGVPKSGGQRACEEAQSKGIWIRISHDRGAGWLSG